MTKKLTNMFQGTRTIFFARLIVFYLLFQTVLRTVLLFFSRESVSWQPWELVKTFAFGAVYDFFVILTILAPLLLFFILLPAKYLNKKATKIFIAALTFLFFLNIIFTGISQYFFWEEFQANFNFIAVDYLIYTTEVLGNINEAYNLALILPVLFIATLLATYWQTRTLKRQFVPLGGKRMLTASLLTVLAPVLCYTVLDSQWRNVASSNKYNVEIAGNGAYEFVSAFVNNELDYANFYATRDNAEVVQGLRTLLKTSGAEFLTEKSIYRHIRSDKQNIRPNIVMIIVESLSADFMQSFGNTENLTPNLDRLAKQSLFFTKHYATGTRTVRGLEALSLSVPPTPGQSIVRRPENEDMYLLGSVLKEQGYQASFVYGGYGYFDNMNSFLEKNGYKITDRTDIPKDEVYFSTVWGVADEIIFAQALQQMDTLHSDNQQKAFQVILTTSNHSPYTYPEDRIDTPGGTRNGAVQYTDWAINDYLEKAREKEWFDDTVFIIVGDHQANSAGKVDLPVNRYHVPLLIYSPALIQPAVNDRLISQIDVPPTLLGLLGFSYDSNFLGFDINATDAGSERAFISTYQNLGYIKEDKLVILKPQRKVEVYKILDYANSEYQPLAGEEALVNEAIAWYQGTSYLYKNNYLKSNKYLAGMYQEGQ